ncbi:SpoIIE family protein phosphatase [Streptomyces sp. NPDC006997]|uniref:PP2C family protein-serine/threonine phosphatase n=1 Tax=Streptomyces sp. NPDC006997 TaxID=3155356 RepID=UPI00340AC6D9
MREPAIDYETPFRILLVEDDDGDALLVEELLVDTDLRHSLVRCRTAAEARRALAVAPYDCVLLDLHLPDASGLGTVAAVQDADTETDTAIIVLTGLVESRAGVDALAAGAQDYLVKGKVEPELLQRAVRYAVQRKRAERASAALQVGRVRAAENARLERGLLPEPILSSGSVTATSRYFPGRAQALLGGDFLDVVQTPDGIVHAVIGDVSGHGPDAAALGVCLRIAWRTLTLGGHRGHELLHLLERIHIAERTGSDLFTTCTVMALDPASATVTLYLVGHHEPVLLTSDGAHPVSAAHGVALGIVPGLGKWPATTLSLPPTGALIAYTDGLIEGYGAEPGADGRDGGGRGEDARLGVDGLLRVLEKTRVPDPGRHLNAVLDTVRAKNAERHTDDLAVLRLDWTGVPETGRDPSA